MGSYNSYKTGNYMLPAHKLSRWIFPYPDLVVVPRIPSHIGIPNLLDFPYPDLLYRVPIGIRIVDMRKSFELLMGVEKGL